MKYAFLLMSSLLLMQCPSSDSNDYKKRTFRASNGVELPYRVLFPENYDVEEVYPVLLFLHGAGERGHDNEAQLAHISSRFQQESFRKEYPSIIIFPQCAEDDSWAYVVRQEDQWLVKDTTAATPAMEATLEMFQDFISSHPVDKSRMYIAGLSMGGFGTYDLLVRRPDYFAAAVPICGGGNKRYTYKYKDTPIWMFHGAKDPVVPVELSRELADEFAGRKMNFQYTEYPEGGHDVWTDAWNEPGLVPWIFRQRKPQQE